LGSIKRWFEDRLGFIDSILKPIPYSAFNFTAWLGALAVISFILQGITGVVISIHYTPTPEHAYKSVMFIRDEVPFGIVLLGIHRYNAYLMIIYAFLHFIRNLIAGAYTRPRELTWLTGMLLGALTLGSGFTGYLLQWSTISKAATTIGLGLIGEIPGFEPLSWHLLSLPDAELLRLFFVLHTMLIPGLLFIWILVKMWLFEVHGILGRNSEERIAWFHPTYSGLMYTLMLVSFHFFIVLLVVGLFPPEYPPEYVPGVEYGLPLPEWYFLWLYQILKIDFVGGGGFLVIFIILIITIAILLFLPLIVREKLTVTKFIALVLLIFIPIFSLWAYLTPGQTISVYDAFMVLVSVVVLALLLHLFSGKILRTLSLIKPTLKLDKRLSTPLYFSMLSLLSAICALMVAMLLPQMITLYCLLSSLSFLSSGLFIRSMHPWRWKEWA
jgi:quinol-cytochrome oxidoreductase complex cytochrome b subunit